MSKEKSYRFLMDMLRKNHEITNIDNNIGARGNIAYFVDAYYDTLEWCDNLARIEKLDTSNNTNELCWYLFQKNYESYCRKREVSAESKRLKILSAIYGFTEGIYKRGELNFFLIVEAKYFPKWFQEAEHVKKADLSVK